MNGKPIRVLAPEVAARIAAGEVVERPVSVVRELLDNAIDAGSGRIAVEIEGGGIAMIRVVDDGRGIAPGDAELAFERHATSKISEVGDLSGVATLGFRGEALPSIAAAADVDVVTRASDEPMGVQLQVVEGRVSRRRARSAPTGTSMAVLELFARLPARRKFLGSATKETRAIVTLLSHYALAYPSIAFKFVNNSRTGMQTPGDGEPRHAFAAVFGTEVAERMLPVDHQLEEVHVIGLAAPPDVTRGNRSGISVFVNRRWIQSRSLGFVVVDAYKSLLPSGRYPLVSILVDLPLSEVDVNVHPAKAEVRFQDERMVAHAIRQGIALAVGESPPATWDMTPGPGVAAQPALSLRERLMPAAGGSSPSFLPPSGLSAEAQLSQREALPLLRLVGQMAATFIVCEGPDGMYLVDQHAAHERILFDRLMAAPSADPSVQPLLEPALLELEPGLAVTASEYRAELEAVGLALESFGERSFLVRSVPSSMAARDPAGEVRAIIEDLAAGRTKDEGRARAAASIACHSSVRAGMAMASEEMRRLLEDLEATDSPRTCPHGRPTTVQVSRESIERQFGRR
ncbi:MAG TPA: DNA mismatch repair endonuclease MutL [Dehalococcoidia bacterium]|nr:DNA mismatch repair endonuclease MutL [Dehalococcoidia bacterium]